LILCAKRIYPISCAGSSDFECGKEPFEISCAGSFDFECGEEPFDFEHGKDSMKFKHLVSP